PTLLAQPVVQLRAHGREEREHRRDDDQRDDPAETVGEISPSAKHGSCSPKGCGGCCPCARQAQSAGGKAAAKRPRPAGCPGSRAATVRGRPRECPPGPRNAASRCPAP